jgi:hypothetical protein
MEGSDSGLTEVLSRNFSGGTEENDEKSVRVADVASKILIEHFRN